MRFIQFFILGICFLPASSQNNPVDLYNLQFKSINGQDIDMHVFKNKHLIVAEFDAANPDRGELLFLDSLYNTNTSHIGVIAVPALDFGKLSDTTALKVFLFDTLSLPYTITDIGYAKKGSGSNQHTLLKWITNISENGHVDDDVSEQGQFYIISSTGILYANLVKADTNNAGLISFLITNDPGTQ